MLNLPLISIALPVYNGEDYLEEAIQSVLAQDFADWELVIADNASTDGTEAILRRHAETEPRIRVHRAGCALGQVENVNRAVGLCQAEWVQFLCHDDVFAPGALAAIARQIRVAAGTRVALIGHGTAPLYPSGWWVESGGSIRRYHPAQYFAGVKAVGEGQIHSGVEIIEAICSLKDAPPLPALTTACVRREVLGGIGMFDIKYLHFDHFAWLTLLPHADYVWIEEILSLTRIHRNQVAVAVRKSLRSVRDHEVFWGDYVRGLERSQALGWRGRVLPFMKCLSIAGSCIGIECKRRGWRAGVRLATELSPKYWPFLPVMIARYYRREGIRAAPLLAMLPRSEVYP
jgi:glycosyltransferase involved in cell wall biosynthesis